VEVLIAEDDPVSQRLLEANLKKWGHVVILCNDGDEAWERMKSPDTPKIAILDWMMPGIEGPELCSRVRELDHGKLMHLILLTARETRDDLVKGLEAGANDYITKPFDRDELRARFDVGRRVIELQEALIHAEKYRVLTQAAGAAAHEINQPLTALLGTADLMLLKLPDDDPSRETFETFQKAGERIRDIVKKMQTIRDVVTRPYIHGIEIIDFDASSGE
jgi:DNA-binding response OmpR family regulator